MDNFNQIISFYNNNIGPVILLLLLIPAGLLFAVILKMIQFRKFTTAIKIVAGLDETEEHEGDISHFQALSAALSATVGIGNIAGVAIAIAWGGPGAAFWIWITGFLGMGLKYAECTLAVEYREKDSEGMVAGGPMYYIKTALSSRLGKFATYLSFIFAIGTIMCSFGTGNMPQANSMAMAIHDVYSIPTWVSGAVIAVLVFLVIVGGIKRIGKVAGTMVPFMAAFYILGALTIVVINYDRLGAAFGVIFRSAFTGESALKGGFIGTMLWGIRRGLFSNEAGQGSAPIAHAAAKTNYSVREGLVSMLEPFIDTVLICTLTSLVIILGGLYLQTEGGKPMFDGAVLTTESFRTGLAPIGLGIAGRHLVAISTVLFALSTSITWSYYGDRSVQFIFRSPKAVFIYRVIFSLVIFVGAVQPMKTVWSFADMAITLMALPNLIALFFLSKKVYVLTQNYFKKFPD
ncbi:MAG: alanine/glycine:cation symporter family protein [Deltaproteobacteria bacterium]|jgi:AGCS family alanine or glycine:cation symporter|nr:alanine/glycine:cation symporter family protein [Deltaproteobacteria bacterium]